MECFHIDTRDGRVHLPNGVSIGPDLMQDAFRARPEFSLATSRDYGTLPWIHYEFDAGQIDGKCLLASICFYDQALIDMALTVNFYPPGEKDWSHYSLEVEAQTKQFHEQLLTDALGRPSRGASLFLGRIPKREKTLERPVEWRYHWGCVTSCHDSKGGGTYIVVSYGDRKVDANDQYRVRHHIRTDRR